MRGRPIYSRRGALRIRNTPVCAGKTQPPTFPIGYLQKHPRVCGEDATAAALSPCVLETPPCVRGRPLHTAYTLIIRRNTPVCAGKTNLRVYDWKVGRKHPRVCGEDVNYQRKRADISETPPCVRGRRLFTISTAGRNGNTPVCAGKTEL